MVSYLLFEFANGYALFDVEANDVIGHSTKEAQKAMSDFGQFSQRVKYLSGVQFETQEIAVENICAINEGKVHDVLKRFLNTNLPHDKCTLMISDKTLAADIQEQLKRPSLSCKTDANSAQIIRFVRAHFNTYLRTSLPEVDVDAGELGLAHAYSRHKVQFNANRADNMIIQAINTVDQLDKDINQFTMRTREWYSWHFPELATFTKEPAGYTALVLLIGDRTAFINRLEAEEAELTEQVAAIMPDEGVAEKIVNAARLSMGQEIAQQDLETVLTFAYRLAELIGYRRDLLTYLESRMNAVAPNLSALIGNVVGARLIAQAGSLTNLAKCPASTIQILGAEKALFRAIKSRGNTPKYGILYHSSFVGNIKANFKGRISRLLANKCSIASRVDCFSDDRTDAYGNALKGQVEERVKFLLTGKPPQKNVDVMHQIFLERRQAMQEEAAAKGEAVPAVEPKEEPVETPEERAARKAARKAKKAAKKAKKESARDKKEKKRDKKKEKKVKALADDE
ncbi:putative snoRNA binding domain [Carpediemonas membranifera]|uniref:Nucleolar protein 56 n=1 Tax=Carpediemonas membranifera TaxID=201153 RepID=A0A8J6E1M9_9EUKA|nr:putative snoRNA binding domain [Carpediemonas membranifera]|eukprot:KAG9396564.1 putative snoRNA binding domain [Carpediemonas membranifera]